MSQALRWACSHILLFSSYNSWGWGYHLLFANKELRFNTEGCCAGHRSKNWQSWDLNQILDSRSKTLQLPQTTILHWLSDLHWYFWKCGWKNSSTGLPWTGCWKWRFLANKPRCFWCTLETESTALLPPTCSCTWLYFTFTLILRGGQDRGYYALATNEEMIARQVVHLILDTI